MDNAGQSVPQAQSASILILKSYGRQLADPNTKVVAQVAPAVRVAVGDFFGMARGENVMGKIVNVLHRMGFDEVFDTAYGADLTVIEESKEFLERLVSGKNLPLFTSCCPAWVSFCENRYPEFKQKSVHLQVTPADVRCGHTGVLQESPEKWWKETTVSIHYAVYSKKGRNTAGGIQDKRKGRRGLCTDHYRTGYDD